MDGAEACEEHKSDGTEEGHEDAIENVKGRLIHTGMENTGEGRLHQCRLQMRMTTHSRGRSGGGGGRRRRHEAGGKRLESKEGRREMRGMEDSSTAASVLGSDECHHRRKEVMVEGVDGATDDGSAKAPLRFGEGRQSESGTVL